MSGWCKGMRSTRTGAAGSHDCRGRHVSGRQWGGAPPLRGPAPTRESYAVPCQGPRRSCASLLPAQGRRAPPATAVTLHLAGDMGLTGSCR